MHRLKRLLAIRETGEEIERRNLQVAFAAANEAEQAVERQHRADEGARLTAEASLMNGDRSGRLFAEAEREVAQWNCARLRRLLEERRERVEPALAAYRARRMDLEQIRHIVRQRGLEEQLDRSRKAQIDADEWFLTQSRRRP